MAINRYYTPAQSQPFDPYIVDTATMYGNLRQAGYDNLLAKQQLDVNTQNEIGKSFDSLKAFAPENTEVFIPLNNGGSKTEQSKLPSFYNQMTSGIYKEASDLAAKYNNNYTSPEAQKEVSDYLQHVKSILPKLQELKNSDKVLGEQNKIGEEHLKNTPLDALQGTLGEHVKSVRDKWVNPNDFNFHTSLSAPTKGVNMSEAINKYIGDNLIRNHGDEAYKKLGVVVGADGIPTFDISKTSEETRKRLEPELDKLADNFTKTNKNHIHNVALEGMQNKELTQGLKDQKDAEKTYLDAFSNKELEWKNRFREHEINDKKTKTDITSKIVPSDYAKKGGLGLFDPLKSSVMVENFVMDNKNPINYTNVDKDGKYFVNNPNKVGVYLNGKIQDFNNPQELISRLEKEGAVFNDTDIDEINRVFNNKLGLLEGGGYDAGNRLMGKDFNLMTDIKDKNGNRLPNIDPIVHITKGETVDFNDQKQVAMQIYKDENLRNILSMQGINIRNPNKVNLIQVKTALKEHENYLNNTVKVASNGWVNETVNNKLLGQKLSNELGSTTVRLGKKENLSDNLKNLVSTKDYSVAGDDLKKYIADRSYDVKVGNMVIASGQSNTPLSFKVTYDIKNANGTTETIDAVIDSPFVALNNNPDLKALDEVTKLEIGLQPIKNKQLNIDGENYTFNLSGTKNPYKKRYDYSGTVILPSGKTIDYNDWKRDVTVGTIIKASSANSVMGDTPTQKEIDEYYELYDNQ